MKRFLELNNLEIAQAAVKDANEKGLNAVLESKDNKHIVSYELAEAFCDSEQKKESESSYVTYDDMSAMWKSFYSEMEYSQKWMKEDYSYLEASLREHKKGHLPPINDAGKMEAALKTLGMADSCKVEKPSVYVEY